MPTTITVASNMPSLRGNPAWSSLRGSIWSRQPFAGVLLDRVQVQRNSQSGALRHSQHAVLVQFPGDRHELIDVGRAGEVLHQVGASASRGQLQVGGQPQAPCSSRAE